MATDRTSRMPSSADKVQHRDRPRHLGIVGTIRETFQRFNQARAGEAAASMAYYAFFALFPLLLALIVAASFVLQSDVAQQQLLDAISNVLPGSRQIVSDNIQHVLATRGAIGLVALLGLIWSAAGGLDALLMNINRAWPGAHARSFVQRRMLSLKLIAGLILVFIISLIGSATLNFLPQFTTLAGSATPGTLAPIGWIALLVPLILRIVMFWVLYRWVPSVHVKNSAAFAGALFAAVGWEIITALFALYLRSGLANYDLVYGTVGAVVALMFWMYWIGWITLFGAHLAATIDGAIPPVEGKL